MVIEAGGFMITFTTILIFFTCLTYHKHSPLKWCEERFFMDKHLGEILSGKVFKFNIGRWEKAWSEDVSTKATNDAT